MGARNIQKQARAACAICGPAEDLAWLWRATHAIAHGNGPPSPAEVHAYRRQFERDALRARRQVERAHPEYARIADTDEQRAWLRWCWQLEVERHPEWRVPTGRGALPVSGLVLYVLTTSATQLLEHDATLPPGERRAHFVDGLEITEIVRLGRDALQARRSTRRDLDAAGLEIRVTAQHLDLEERTVRNRLRPAHLHMELTTARARGELGWVSWQQLLQSARFRGDTAMIGELYRCRVVHPDVARVTRDRRALIELATAAHPSRPAFVRVLDAQQPRS